MQGPAGLLLEGRDLACSGDLRCVHDYVTHTTLHSRAYVYRGVLQPMVE